MLPNLRYSVCQSCSATSDTARRNSAVTDPNRKLDHPEPLAPPQAGIRAINRCSSASTNTRKLMQVRCRPTHDHSVDPGTPCVGWGALCLRVSTRWIHVQRPRSEANGSARSPLGRRSPAQTLHSSIGSRYECSVSFPLRPRPRHGTSPDTEHRVRSDDASVRSLRRQVSNSRSILSVLLKGGLAACLQQRNDHLAVRPALTSLPQSHVATDGCLHQLHVRHQAGLVIPVEPCSAYWNASKPCFLNSCTSVGDRFSWSRNILAPFVAGANERGALI